MKNDASPIAVQDDDLLYAEIRRQVSKAVARLCPASLSADRDDLVQTAMIRLHQILNVAEGIQSLASSYVWRTAFTVMVDELRRRTRRAETSLADSVVADVMPDRAPDPERQAMARELGHAIRGCLRRLADSRRAAVVLHLQGHAVPQIAQLLGWGGKKADNLVYRGLADLRACLAAKGLRV